MHRNNNYQYLNFLFIFTSITVPLMAFSLPKSVSEEHCFKVSDNKALKIEIFQQAPPPPYKENRKDYPESTAFYPVTTYASGNAVSLSKAKEKSASGFQFGKQYFLWGNRCIFMKGLTPNPSACRNMKVLKGNYYTNITEHSDGSQLRPAFSTYEKANQCTLMQAERMLGKSRKELETKATGLLLWEYTDQASLASLAKTAVLYNGSKRNYLIDVCILESTPMASDGTGIFIDWEVQDHRTAPETFSFFQQLKAITLASGKELNIFTNDLTTGGPKNGLDETNIRKIIDLVSGFAPVIWSGATAGKQESELKSFSRRWSFIANLEKQMNLITNNGKQPLPVEMKKKLILATSIFDMNLEEAKALHTEVVNNKYRGFVFWRNFAKLGGPCARPENRLISCLAFGKCSNE